MSRTWHDVLVEQITWAENVTLSAHVWLPIGVVGVGRVRGGQRVEDELRGGVSTGTRAIGAGVPFRMCLGHGDRGARPDELTCSGVVAFISLPGSKRGVFTSGVFDEER